MVVQVAEPKVHEAEKIAVQKSINPYWILFGIILVAGALRLWGVAFGLPYEYHVDEVQYVRQAASMGTKGFAPTWWNNPPFLKYILFAEYAALFVIGKVLGAYKSAAAFGAASTVNPTILYLAGRATSALFGAFTVPVVFWLTRAAYGKRAALIAAWFVAVCFMLVRDSHYATNDIAVTFFMMLSLLAAVYIAKTGERRYYLLGGISLGLGFATKYSAAFVIVALLAAHLALPDVSVQKMRLEVKRFAIIPVSAAITAIIASPYFLLEPGAVFRDAYAAIYAVGANGFDGWEISAAGGYIFYLQAMLWGMGYALLALALVGVLASAIRHSKFDVILLTVPAIFYVVLGHQQQMYFVRYFLPAVPPLLILAAVLLDRAAGRLPLSSRHLGLALTVATLAVTVQPLLASTRSDWLLSQTDTRTQAKVWIESNLPAGSTVAVDWPFFGPDLSTAEKQTADSTRSYRVIEVNGHGLSEHPISWYRSQGVDYLVVSSFISDLSLSDPSQDRARKAFYATLNQRLVLMKEFRPYAGQMSPPFTFDELYGPAISLWQRDRPGPTIQIYRVTQTGD